MKRVEGEITYKKGPQNARHCALALFIGLSHFICFLFDSISVAQIKKLGKYTVQGQCFQGRFYLLSDAKAQSPLVCRGCLCGVFIL